MRARWIALGFAAIAAAILAAWLLRSTRGVGDPAPTVPTADPEAAGPETTSGLSKGAGVRKPGLPSDAVEIEVVAREGQAPVEGVRLRLRGSLGRAGEPVGDFSLGTTDATGHARLAGTVPGFVEVVDPSWAAADGVLGVEGGKAYRVEVTPRVVYRAMLRDEATGLALASWVVSPGGPAHELSKTDGTGVASLPSLRGAPNMIAAWDGARRLHTFFLYTVESRVEVRLEVPAATRSTRLRAVDPEGRPVASARAHLIEERVGIAIDFDARGELEVDYAASGETVVVVTAPGRSRHPVSLQGEPVLEVVLEATTTRVFRLVRADGKTVPDGTRLAGDAGGPASYGQRALFTPFDGTSRRGEVVVDGLPAGEFLARLEVSGSGTLSKARVSAPADPAVPIDVPVGSPRPFSIRAARAGPAGSDPVPATGPLWARVAEPTGCAWAPGASDLFDDVRAGTSSVGTLWHAPGPEARVLVPTSDEAVGVEIGSRTEGYACLRIEANETGGARAVQLTGEEGAAKRALTPITVEFTDGMAAALQQLVVRRDEPGGGTRRVGTDSAGTAYLEETSGRFVVEATTNDGARYESDGPILLPSREPVVVRLRPVSR